MRLLSLIPILIISTCAQASAWKLSSHSTWELQDDSKYSMYQGSASNYLHADQRVKHRELRIRVKRSLTDSYTFSVGCVLESKTPSFTLRVNGLDISMIDTANGYVFARFLVDDRQEYSLRGEILSASRIAFMPYTRGQEEALSNLFLQLNEGGHLSIALLQGKKSEPRIYNVELAGFRDKSQIIVQDCQRLFSYARGKTKYLPDYMSNEPDNVAPEKFSLKVEEEGVDPKRDLITDQYVDRSPKQKTKTDPIIHDFKPDGSIASIGADGKPIGSDKDTKDKVKNDKETKDDLGVANGPMQIDDQGNPIF